MMRDTFLFSMLNLAICSGVGFVCLCRINAMHIHVRFGVRLKYACYLGAATVSGIKPLWGEWPDWGSVSVAFLLLIGLLSSSTAWGDDQAPSGATDFHRFPPFPESRR
jgi:hypothetical protein